jgi:hypothetical protein
VRREFELAADFVIDRVELRSVPDAIILPKIYSFDITPTEQVAVRGLGLVDPNMMQNGAYKDLVAKTIRSLRADHPTWVIAFLTEAWVAEFDKGDEQPATLDGHPASKDAILIALYRGAETLQVIHYVDVDANGKKSIGPRRALEADVKTGRFVV